MANSDIKFGLHFFATDMVSDTRDVARAAEDHGFESLLFADHSHIPVSRDTPYRRGGDLPDHYIRTFDPLIACTAAACVTERLIVGTSICILPERDPIILAKEVATLDLMSGGRVLFGVGTGWNAEELADHGVVFSQRFAITDDRLGLIRELWTNEVAAFESPHANLRPSWQWPKPVQNPVPVMIGGDGPKSMKMAIKHRVGWYPMSTAEPLENRMAQMAGFAAEADEPVPPTTFLTRLTETADPEALQKIGVERVVLMLPVQGDAVAGVKKFASEFGIKP